MAKTIGSGDPKDFDETRRLCYMALAAPRTERYNLAGTLVNALVHHHATGMDADEVMDQVIGAIEGSTETPPDLVHMWLRDQIARITRELGD